ncbi:MAG: hypothetical protein U5K51_03550 [Flavobacteriaceae bacterium]|nr:hypothetical protein [Flavobacteriaceae bacterium]
MTYASEYGIAFNYNERKPLFTPLSSEDADYKIFEFDELTEENQDTYEEDVNLFINAQLPLSFLSDQEGFLEEI